MRLLFGALCLSFWFPFFAARSAAPVSSSSSHRRRFPVWGRSSALSTPRGGGKQDYSVEVNSIGSLFSAASTVFAKEVAPILKRESQSAAAYVKQFLEQQKENAAQRRQVYREQANDLGKTASTLADPLRAAKLTLSAFVLAEAIQYIDAEGFQLDDLSDLAAVAADNFVFQAENFWKVGRQPGGLLQLQTYTSRQNFFQAMQEQVLPKYQWAMGAAFGFVVSPVLWTLGFKVWGGLAVVYLVAEGHHLAKRRNDVYFNFLKATQNPLIFVIDDLLEDLREFIEAVTADPMGTLGAMRDRIDSKIDLDLQCPVHLQQGFLFGAFVGVVSGF